MTNIRRIPTPFSYSSAVRAGDFVFLGLQRGFGEGFTEQFHSAFGQLKQTLDEFGLNLSDVVKVNVWLKHIQDLPEMEKLFNNYFEKDQFPARMTSTTEFIDADCLMMIDGVVYKQEQGG